MHTQIRPFKAILVLWVSLCCTSSVAFSQFTRPPFFQAMAGESVEAVDAQLSLLEKSDGGDKDAYEGALLMKKAGLVKNKLEKLNLFKSGRRKLEAVIEKDSSNAEFRFLRLQIQEHAPKIVKYKENIESDKKLIIAAYKNLPPEVQHAVEDYSKHSEILKPADL